MTSASDKATKSLSPRARRKRRERWFMVATVVLILTAWLYGYFTSGTAVAPLVKEVLPAAENVEQRGSLFVGQDAAGEVIGYAAVGEAPGYGGPLEVLVGVNAQGDVVGIHFLSQRESPGFFRLLERSDLLAQVSQARVQDPLQVGQDLDAVSGATISAQGVAGAVRSAAAEIAEQGLQEPRPAVQQAVDVGAPELVLLLLFASGYVGHRWRNGVWKRRVRWATLLTGMIVLGFLYTAPLTITMIISLLSGYWPDWHNNLYWYLLLGGIIFVTTVDAKNPYCHWFCPFGALQECLATVSGAKFYRPRQYAELLTWLQRGLALVAIVLGLALRRPGVAGYEPFATLFDLQGGLFSWALLVVILLASLALYRPFCNYLCPLDAVIDFIAAARRWGKETVTQWRASVTNG
ncbi:MAG TPA: FMN-binding protein [Candidatus Sulfomarinibacteraceae bacterium]|nr:FMN-binding protein [Candidatus Sulfomarinibacteraceae bacterium]